MLFALVLAAALAGASPPQPLQTSLASPAPVTLNDAVTQARAASPLLGAARSQAEGTADASRLVARLPNPTFDFRMENMGSSAPSGVLPRDVFAEVSMPIELNGRRGLRRSIAAADRDVAAGHLQSASYDVSVRTVQAYLQALKARALVETLAANRDGLAGLIETMTRRVAEGVAPESDLLRFQTESARMDIDVAKAGLELERSLNLLAFVMGSPAPIAAAQLVEPPPAAPPALDDAALAQAVARHPDVATAAARVTRAQQLTALERSRTVPDPIVVAGYKRTAGFDTALAGISVSVPLFERSKAATARAEGDERAAMADRAAVARRLTADAVSLIATARVLSERSTRAARELLAPADVVRNAARSAFREGAADVVRLLDAERVYSDVRRVALELRLDALAAALEVRLAMGEDLP